MLAAALREGFRGPVFIQGDHFQVNAKKYAVDPDDRSRRGEGARARGDRAPASTTSTSTRRRSSTSRKPTLDEQQRLNYEVGIDILTTVRELEPKGVTISVGGEIGEVGTQNSTVEELRAYMDGFNAQRCRRAWTGCRRSACSPARRTAASCLPTARSPT